MSVSLVITPPSPTRQRRTRHPLIRSTRPSSSRTRARRDLCAHRCDDRRHRRRRGRDDVSEARSDAAAHDFAESMRLLHETVAQGAENIRQWAEDIRSLSAEDE